MTFVPRKHQLEGVQALVNYEGRFFSCGGDSCRREKLHARRARFVLSAIRPCTDRRA